MPENKDAVKEDKRAGKRIPIDLVCVIDVSGSMSG